MSPLLLIEEGKSLTPRQLEIAHLVARGLLNKQISHELNLTLYTVKAYLRVIFERVEVKNRAELAAYVVRKHGDNF